MMRASCSKQAGFSLVEIMVALVILSMSAATIVTLQRASVRGAVNARELTIASMLARSIMVDAYLEKYKDDLKIAIAEEKTGEAEMAGLQMKWTWTLREVPLEIPAAAAEEDSEDDGGSEANPMMNAVTESVNKYLAEAMRELAVKVTWPTAGREREIYFVTHLIDFSTQMPIPNIPLGAMGGGL